MYQIAPPEPFWLDFAEGVRVRFRPVSRTSVRAARRAVRETFLGVEDDARESTEVMESAGSDFAASLIARGIIEFEGIAGPDGEALQATPEGIECFLSDPVLMDWADEVYVGPYVEKEAEKNGYALSRNGTSAGAIAGKPSAKTARPSAKSAPTKSTPPKQKPVRSHGTSSKPAAAKSGPRSAGRSGSTSKRS